MSDIDIQWHNLLRDYFNLSLTDSEAVRWFSEIQAKYRNITNERLCGAIRWASDERNYRRPDRAGKPTVQELLKWLGMSWAASNTERNIHNLQCSMCDGSGWVSFARTLIGISDFTFNDYNMAITTKIPCACSVGRNTFQANYGPANKKHLLVVDENKQLAVSKEAVRQRQRYARLREQLERGRE